MADGSCRAVRERQVGPAAARRIERDALEPAYVQLADILRQRIAEGEYHAGDRLPTEAELMRAYGLSPVTVRRAVKILVDEGSVTATPGRGTFVEAASIAAATFDLRSFRAILADPAVKVRMLSVRVVPASGRVARMLEIEEGARVRHATFGDGVVVSCVPDRDDYVVTIAFKGGAGIKKLMLSMTSLELV